MPCIDLSIEPVSFLAQEWTILDVHFGVPLFDVDCNTRICEYIVKHLVSDAMYVHFGHIGDFT